MDDCVGVDVLDATPEEEEWRPIPNWGGLYEASSLGRIRRIVGRGRWGYYPKITVLKPRVGVQGYLTVGLWRDGVSQTNMVHRLVARAFYGPRPDDLEIRHLDDDKLNNWVVNLIYGTRRENKLDAVRNGIHDQSRKTHCPRKHEYTEENTYHSPGRPNARWCRKCTRIRNQEYAARQREKAGKAKQR